MIEDPAAVAQCSSARFHTPRVSPFEASRSGESCPDKSQVGVVTVHTSLGGGETRSFGLYDLAPPPGAPSQLGFNAYGTPVVLTPRIRQAEGEYGVTLALAGLSQRFDLYGLTMTLWGVPWALTHNTERGNCLNEADPEDPWGKCSVGRPAVNPAEAYLSLPPSCAGPLRTVAVADSWQHPGAYLPSGEPDLSDPAWKSAASTGPQGLQGCDRLHFNPEASGRLTTARASSPTGFDLGFTVRDDGLTNPKLTAPSPLRKAVVALPEGITVNPSLAAGLGDCTPGQYAAETVSSAPGAGCPDDSKIGDISVQTPLFGEPLEGSIYLAAPHDNPFDTLIALYVVARSAQRGILVKVAGEVQANPSSGQLTATFDRLPQLPYSSFNVIFREGQRSPLLTPQSCGSYVTAIDLHPWLDPESALEVTSPFAIDQRDRRRRLPERAGHALRPHRAGRLAQLPGRRLLPLLPPPGATRHRTGDHLLLGGAAPGRHRPPRRRPLLPRGRDRSGQARRAGPRRKNTPPARRRRRSAARSPATGSGRCSPTRRGGCIWPGPTAGSRSRWWRSTRPRSGRSTSARW